MQILSSGDFMNDLNNSIKENILLLKELFKEFVKNQDPPLSTEVIRECQSLLIN